MVWFGDNLKNPLVPTPFIGQEHLSLEQVAQNSIQHLQEGAVMKNKLLNFETDAVSW